MKHRTPSYLLVSLLMSIQAVPASDGIPDPEATPPFNASAALKALAQPSKNKPCKCRVILEAIDRRLKELSALEASNGRNSQEVGLKLIPLARLYLSSGQPEKAEAADLRALSIFEKANETQPAVIGPILVDLAAAYSKLDDKQKSQSFLSRALSLLGKDTKDPIVLNQIASVYQYQKNWQKTEYYQRHALELLVKNTGADSLEVANQLERMSSFHQSRGLLKQAAGELQASVDVKKRKLPETNPGLYLTLDRLGWMYLDSGQYAKAEKLFQTVIEQREKVIGKEHPNLVLSLKGQAKALRSLNRAGQAQKLEDRARAIASKHLKTGKRT